MLALPDFDIDDLGKESLQSPDVILSFLKRHRQMAEEFASRAGINVVSWEAELRADHPTEPPPDPRPAPVSEAQKRIGEMLAKMDEERETEGKASAFSKPLKLALKAARDQAREAGVDTFTLGGVLAGLLRTDSVAANVTRAVCDPELLESALTWLQDAPDPEAALAAAQPGAMNELLDRIWPKVLEQQKREMTARSGSDRIQEWKEKDYAEHPEKYEQSLDVFARLAADVPEKDRFTHRSGTWMRAAANEARIRRAPEVTLDHLFYALLQDGTDSAALLDARGVNRDAWRSKVDSELPRYDNGPRWPPNVRDLGMNIPDGKERIVKKEIPDDLNYKALTPEQRREYIEVRPSKVEFTDLMWLRASSRETKTIGYRLLAEAGITEDAVRAELKVRETGDPDWFKVRPNLAEMLRNAEPGLFGIQDKCRRAVEDAAQFEARARWAQEIVIEDVLLALMADGTDTADLCDSLGIDRGQLAEELDAMLPRSESGPYFPPEGPNVHLFGISLVVGKTSDLKFIEQSLKSQVRTPKPEKQPALDLLVQRGLTLDAVQGRLRELGVETLEM